MIKTAPRTRSFFNVTTICPIKTSTWISKLPALYRFKSNKDNYYNNNKYSNYFVFIKINIVKI